MAGKRVGSPGQRAKRGRISRSAEFDRVYRQGRSKANRYLVVHAFPRASDGEPRLGLSVSRKVGNAVERNRVKRLLREAFDEELERIGPGVDLVIVARPDARGLAERDGLDGMRSALAELLDASAPQTQDPGS